FSTKRVAERYDAADNRLEHWLHICGRPRDHLKDLTGRREFTITRLQLREQPDILDGDDRLVGEGLQQGDLPLGEQLRLCAAQHDRTDRGSFTQQRNAERRPLSQLERETLPLGEVLRNGEILDVEDPAF